MKMKTTTIISLAGIALGLLAGYAYWYFVGCDSGTCAITSSPWRSSLYGGGMGFLMAGLIKNDKN